MGGLQITPKLQATLLKEAVSAMKDIKVLAPVNVAKALEAKGVKIKQSGEFSQTNLLITSHHIDSFSDEDAIHTHDIWFQVVLHDSTIDKDVWSGDFKVFVFSTGSKDSGVSPEFLEKFAQSIVAQLVKAELL